MITMENIIDDHNPLIREKSLPVDLPLSEEDRQLLTEMHEYLINSQDEEKAQELGLRPGVGIAAVQVGVLKRMCAVHVENYDDEGNPLEPDSYCLVNPKIISHSERISYIKSGEGCLSVPEDQQGYVPRYAKVKVRAYDMLKDENIVITARGFLAVCLQHELDHFDGKLYYDHINNEDPFTEIPEATVIE